MARMLADEHFPLKASELLRTLGHNVLTVQEAGIAGNSDDMVLDFASSEGRAVLTFDRHDFFKLHKIKPNHAGIIACKGDSDWNRLATNINTAICAETSLIGKVIRVNRFPTAS